MTRDEALEALLNGHKVVSYHGLEYELTKHGLTSGEHHLPMSDSCRYSLLGNPHPAGTLAWAEYQFKTGHEVTSPSGLILHQSYSGDWERCLVQLSDIEATTWESSTSARTLSERELFETFYSEQAREQASAFEELAPSPTTVEASDSPQDTE